MKTLAKLSSFALAAFIPLACTTTESTQINPATGTYPERIDQRGQPVAIGPGPRVKGATPKAGQRINAVGPIVVDLSQLPAARRADGSVILAGPANKRSHAPGPISDEMMAELRERARSLPPNARAPKVRAADIGDVTAGAPVAAPGFNGPDSGDCCGGSGASVPPDPEMAAGLTQVIAAVNSAFAVYDKSGNVVSAPQTYESLFAGFPECQGTFDPNVVYDESADRFFMGIVGNGNGTHYCMAVSQSGDATGAWNTYSLQVDVNGDFFDFPHAGVGADAIYFGSNMFASSFTQSIIWAVDKWAMYNGDIDPAANSASVGSNFTPQPMNIHGDAAFPAAGSTHYFVANVLDGGTWNGEDFAVFAWSNPLSSAPTLAGTFSLSGLSPLSIGFPVDQPQSGGRRAAVLDGGDWRIQDAEYSTDTGLISMAQAVSCNPGGGTVNCVRWAEIDPVSLTVEDIGIIASSGQFRSYPDTAINACGDIAIGYSKMSSSTFPGIWAAARENGVVGSEFELKAGEVQYTSFQSWRQANRWGDYTGMTIDPDGETFWYLGEYAKDNGLSTNWGTYISSFKLSSCDSGGGDPVATIDSFTASPSTITDGESSTLSWTSTNADSCSLDGNAVAVDGSTTVSPSPAGSYSYTLNCSNSTSSATDTVTITVESGTDPVATIDSFTASPSTITDGESSTLSWASTNADSCSLNGSAVAVDGSTSVSPSPAGSYGYTLECSNSTSSATDSVTVTVNEVSNGGLTITSATGRKQRGVKIVDLAWSGTDGSGNVTITRNGAAVATTADDGAYTDNTGEKGGGGYVYEICEEGTNNCDTASVAF